MKLDRIRNRKPGVIGSKESCAVAIIICTFDLEQYIILEKRASHISQPGEISLPGGRCDEGESIIACAYREVEEELGIYTTDLEFVGLTDYLFEFTTEIHPVVFRYKGRTVVNLKPNEEVSEVVFIPLSIFLKEPELYRVKLMEEYPHDFPFERLINETDYRDRKWERDVYFYSYRDFYIWGFTAKIILEFIKEVV